VLKFRKVQAGWSVLQVSAGAAPADVGSSHCHDCHCLQPVISSYWPRKLRLAQVLPPIMMGRGPAGRPAGGQAADQRLNVLGSTVIEPGLSMLGPQPTQSSARSESESAALTVLLRYYTAVLPD